MHKSLPQTILSPLNRVDGSATCSNNGYSIICGVNGPVEIQRRDELPEEAAVEVVVRPAVGVGGVRERHLESIIQQTLRQIIHVSAHPRTLIQITLQVIATPQDDNTSGQLSQAASNLPILPPLLQTSVLALLSSSIPLNMTLTCTLIAVEPAGGLLQDPSLQQLRSASSVHVLAFSSHGGLLMIESEGEFSINIWEDVYESAMKICRGKEIVNSDDEDMSLDSQSTPTLEDVLREIIREKAAKEQTWKESLR